MGLDGLFVVVSFEARAGEVENAGDELDCFVWEIGIAGFENLVVVGEHVDKAVEVDGDGVGLCFLGVFRCRS